jgi:hypothetical protein
MFPDQDELVKSYIKKENVDFSEEKDILNLFGYCLSLAAKK